MSLLFDVAGQSGIGNQTWRGVTISNSRIVAHTSGSSFPGNMWVLDLTDGTMLQDISSVIFGQQHWNNAVITSSEENIIMYYADNTDDTPGDMWIANGDGAVDAPMTALIGVGQRWTGVIVTPDSTRAIAYANENAPQDGGPGNIWIRDFNDSRPITDVSADIVGVGSQFWWSLAVTSDGTRLIAASGGYNNLGNIWALDISENQLLYDISSENVSVGLQSWVSVTVAMNDTRMLALAPYALEPDGAPGNIWCFNLTSGEVIYDLSSEGIGRDIWDQLVLSPNQTRAVAHSGVDSNSNRNMWFFDVSDCGHIVDISGSVGNQAWTGARFTPDGERVVAFYTSTIDDEPGNLWIFNNITGSVLVDISSSVGPQRWAGAVPYENGDRAQRVVAYTDTDATGSIDDNLPGNMWIFDASDGRIVFDISSSVGPQRWNGAYVTPDRTRLVAYAQNDSTGELGPGNIWVFDLSETTSVTSQTSAPAITNSYILGPKRTQSSRTEFNIGYFIRKPRVGQLDYDMNILRQMSASQARLV